MKYASRICISFSIILFCVFVSTSCSNTRGEPISDSDAVLETGSPADPADRSDRLSLGSPDRSEPNLDDHSSALPERVDRIKPGQHVVGLSLAGEPQANVHGGRSPSVDLEVLTGADGNIIEVAPSVNAFSNRPNMCGPNCLAVILSALDHPASVEEIARLANTDPIKGTSLAGLRNAAEAHGLRGTGLRMRLDEYDQLDIPLIIHLADGHYILLAGRGDHDDYAVIDPPHVKRVSRSYLEKTFSGQVLLVTKR